MTDKKSKAINFRLSLEQHNNIKRAATSYGMTMSDFIITCCAIVSNARNSQLGSLESDLHVLIDNIK